MTPDRNARAGDESQASPEEKRLQIAEEALDYYRRRRLHYRTRLAEQIVKCRWMERRTQKHRRIITRLLALRRVGKERPAGWRPIATAPRDGTEVLVVYPERAGRKVGVGYFENGTTTPGERGGWVLVEMYHLAIDPTGWQPLPAPPEVTPAPDGWDDGSNVR